MATDPIVDAQNEAAYNAQGKNSVYLAAAGDIAGTAAVQTVVSGTPFQISAKRRATMYVDINTSASFTMSMGPEPAGTSVAVAAASADAIGVTTLAVPVGWYVKITGTVADFVITSVVD